MGKIFGFLDTADEYAHQYKGSMSRMAVFCRKKVGEQIRKRQGGQGVMAGESGDGTCPPFPAPRALGLHNQHEGHSLSDWGPDPGKALLPRVIK